MKSEQNDYDISELKQVLESSEVRANADPNKLHYESLSDTAWAFSDVEAKIVADILAVRYPSLLFGALSARVEKLQSYFDSAKKLTEDLDR